MEDYDTSFLYKNSTNVVDSPSRLSMGSVVDLDDGKKELSLGVHRLALLGFRWVESAKGYVMVTKSLNCVFAHYKANQCVDPTFGRVERGGA